jgi:hypothetical protein
LAKSLNTSGCISYELNSSSPMERPTTFVASSRKTSRSAAATY